MPIYLLSSPSAAAAAAAASSSLRSLFSHRRFLHHRSQVSLPPSLLSLSPSPLLVIRCLSFNCISSVLTRRFNFLTQNRLFFASTPPEISARCCSLVSVRAMAGTETAYQAGVSSVSTGNGLASVLLSLVLI